MAEFSPNEQRYLIQIQHKDKALRRYLDGSVFPSDAVAQDRLAYLIGIKNILGNLNNDLGFVATLLAKNYLEQRFGILGFDAAGKAQGASGVDIEYSTADGITIAGELKTTKPYQPGFGAAQRTSIRKDLERLATTKAAYRFMFVIDSDTFTFICRPAMASCAPGIEVVNLVTGQAFICPN